MFIEVLDNSLNIVGEKPLEFNLAIHKPQANEPLFETIKIEDGIAHNLKYHQDRVVRSYQEYYKIEPKLNLKKELINLPSKGIYRAKLIYNKNGLISKDYYIYNKRIVKKLALIEIKNIDYRYKYLDREIFNTLSNFDTDEVIITKDGYISDTTIANIALLNSNNIWCTPTKPLLQGTTLERYLEMKKITKCDIHYKDLKNYSKIAILNAMIDFYLL